MTTPPDQPEDAALRQALHDFAISYQVESRDGRQADIDHIMQLFREHERQAEQIAFIAGCLYGGVPAEDTAILVKAYKTWKETQ